MVWVRLLFPKPLNFFPQHIPVCFRCKIFFSPGISSQDIFSCQISLQDISFWNHPYPSRPSPQKSNGRPLNLTISTISEVLKKKPKQCRGRKKRNLSQSCVKISVEEWETIKCQISNFSKNWTHLRIQSYSQYLSLFSHLNQPYNYLKTINKGLKVQDIDHNSQHTIKYQTG